MRGFLRATTLCVALGLAFSASLFAQATGTVAGLVTDETGAVIPGVTIEVTNTATNQTRTVSTGGDGFYTAPLLQPGPYSVKASLQGFRTVTRRR